jgi:hypothetical protein
MACVVGDGDDDDDLPNIGGSGGSSTGGSAGSTGGTAGTGGATGGTGGAAGGAGGADSVVCSEDAENNTPVTTCEAESQDQLCQVCIQQNCCDEFEDCYAEGPEEQCGFGGPGTWPTEGGEFACFVACVSDPTSEGLSGDLVPGSNDAKAACGDHCRSSNCTTATTMSVLTACMTAADCDADCYF